MPKKKETAKTHLQQIADSVFSIIVFVAIFIGIRTYLVSPFLIDGNSMIDTLQDGEYIIINKLEYVIGSPDRGDVVVFHPPNEDGEFKQCVFGVLCWGRKYYVKRVIGLPGDTVTFRDGQVFIQTPDATSEHVLDEPYLNSRNRLNTQVNDQGKNESRVVVPEEHFFVLGDNRISSVDSRSFGVVPEDNIQGSVWLVVLPVNKATAFSQTEYDLE